MALFEDSYGNMLISVNDWHDKKELDRIGKDLLEKAKNNTLGLDHRPALKVFGKEVHSNRDVGFFADDKIKGYSFSGQTSLAHPMTDDMKELTKVVNSLLETKFNGILINYYADGNDYIGPHGDNENHLDKGCVAGVSFGTTRTFRIKNKKTKEKIIDYPWLHGNLVIMSGNTFQKTYTHEIPKQLKIKEPRISLTWRCHNK